jgi:hypothetical protein
MLFLVAVAQESRRGWSDAAELLWSVLALGGRTVTVGQMPLDRWAWPRRPADRQGD